MSSDKAEFTIERRKLLVPARLPRRRLRQGELFADIIEDRRCHPPLFFCVVQRHGSPEVLSFGQFNSSAEADRAAKEFMSAYLRRKKELGGAAAGR